VQSQKTKQFLNIKNKYLQVSLKCLTAAAEIKTKRTLLTEFRAKPHSRLSFFKAMQVSLKCFTAAAKYKPNKRCCQGLAAKLPLHLVFFFLLFPHSNSRMQERNSLCFFCFFFYCLSLAFFLSFFSYPLSCSLFFYYFSAPFFCYFSALFPPPLARSLEGFIYSLEYLYLGKI